MASEQLNDGKRGNEIKTHGQRNGLICNTCLFTYFLPVLLIITTKMNINPLRHMAWGGGGYVVWL